MESLWTGGWVPRRKSKPPSARKLKYGLNIIKKFNFYNAKNHLKSSEKIQRNSLFIKLNAVYFKIIFMYNKSIFECDKCDVLNSCRVQSEIFKIFKKILTDDFTFRSNFENYFPVLGCAVTMTQWYIIIWYGVWMWHEQPLSVPYQIIFDFKKSCVLWFRTKWSGDVQTGSREAVNHF